MKYLVKSVIRYLFIYSMIMLPLLAGVVTSNAEEMDFSKAVFYVS